MAPNELKSFKGADTKIKCNVRADVMLPRANLKKGAKKVVKDKTIENTK